MKNKIYSAFLLVCISASSFAQIFPGLGGMRMTLDTALIKKITKDACPCLQNIHKINFIESRPNQETKEIGLDMMNCMLGTLRKFKNELNLAVLPDSVFRLDTNNLSTSSANTLLQAFDPRMALYAIRDCPYAFDGMLLVMQNISEESNKRREIIEADTAHVMPPDTAYTEEYPEENYEDDAYKTFTGKLKRIEHKGFVFVVLETDDKKEESLLWLDRFYNSEVLLSDFKKSKGKRVEVTTTKQEYYNPKSKKFGQYRQITALYFLDE
jgi:hypothetical protein